MSVLNFTGKRKSATPLDRKEVADWLRELAEHVESGEVVGFLYAALLAEPGAVRWDWYTLPPSNKFTAIGALQALLADYTNRTLEKCSDVEDGA